MVIPIRPDSFFVGDLPVPMYVEWRAAATRRCRHPLVLVHGGFHTGACWSTTPDGRDGWFSIFPGMGFDSFVVDLPGVGRSPVPEDISRLTLGSYADAVYELLRRVGGAIVVAHGMAGAVAWRVAARCRAAETPLLRGVVALAAAPTNVTMYRRPGEAPYREDRLLQPLANVIAAWTTTSTFPIGYADEHRKSLVAGSPYAFNEVRRAGATNTELDNPDLLLGVPAIMLLGEEEKPESRSVHVEATAQLYGMQVLYTGRDWGLPGHGHMFMMELGSEMIASRVGEWILANVGP